MKRVIHLHFHSEYSFESLTKIEETLVKAQKNGIEAVAITDPYFFGHVKFYSEALKNGVVPILGLEISTSDGDFVILCENRKGYSQLIQFWNDKVLSGVEISVEEVLEHFDQLENVTLLSGHLENFLSMDSEAITKKLEILSETKKFYIQIDLPTSPEKLKEVLELSQKFKIPLTGSYNMMYLEKEEKGLFELFKEITDKKRHKNYCEFKNYKDFLEDFRDLPQVFESFKSILDRVKIFDLKVEFSFPSYSKDDKALLKKEVFDFLLKKFGSSVPEDVKTRVNRELKLISSRNLEGYFLTVKKIVDIARENNILIGPGRGSAVGSLISYSLGITSVDPVKYGLIFERFLNEGRNDLPDIDIDVQDSQRPELLHRLKEYFGEDNFAQVITFGTYGPKLIKREFERKLPRDKLGYALSNIEKFTGLPHHTSIHAAGIILSEKNLKDKVPLLKGETGYITQFDMQDLEKIGVVKIDLLGLKTLTTIKETLKDAGKDPFEILYDNLPIEDKKVFDLLSKGFTGGVFQLDSKSGRSICIKLKPKTFEDISIVLALNRPGPMTSGILESYLKGERTFNDEKINEILEETRGMLIYQEQIMRIVSEIAGLSLGEADEFRRAISKKDPEKIQRYRKKFLDSLIARGFSIEESEVVFDKIINFAGYAFNKSHSVAYSLLTYITAFLKTNFTPYYLKNLLNSHLGDFGKLSLIISEARLLRYKILGIDINKSYELCSVESDSIRLGFAFIKGLGIQKAKSIVEEREKYGEYRNFEEAVIRLKEILTEPLMYSLIRVGAFDSFNESREEILRKFSNMKETSLEEMKKISSKVFGILDNEGNSRKEQDDIRKYEFFNTIQEVDLLGFVLSDDVRLKIAETFGDYQPSVFELAYVLDEGFCPVVLLETQKGMIITDGVSYLKYRNQQLKTDEIYIARFSKGRLVEIIPEDSKKLFREYIFQGDIEKLEESLKKVKEASNSRIIVPLNDHLLKIEGYKPEDIKNYRARFSLI